MPAECDVSIRPGWFYHPAEDNRVRSPENLVDLYYRSVGRGASLLLNLPPDTRGRIHDSDVRSLRGFREILDGTFAVDLAHSASSVSSHPTQDAETGARYSARNAIDGRRDTYWYPGDRATPEISLEFDHPVQFNVVGLREYLPLGQRVEAFALDAWQDGKWRQFAVGTSIGSRRLVRSEGVTTYKVRLRITQAPVGPTLTEFSLFAG